jgi:hypothetical protein
MYIILNQQREGNEVFAQTSLHHIFGLQSFSYENHHNLTNVLHYESKEKLVVHMGCDQNKINQNVTFIIYLSS